MTSLQNLKAVITGGARGIGFSTAKELLRSGVSKILILDLGQKMDSLRWKELSACNPTAEIFYSKCDVTKKQDLENVLRKDAVQWLGYIDILINCAGIIDENDPARCIATNLTALINCSMITLDLMTIEKQGHGGTIVNIASVAGLEGLPSFAIYCASKSGVIGFTRSIGMNSVYDLTGVKMVAICPGATNTNMIQETLTMSFPALTPQLAQLLQNIKLQEPSAVAKAVVQIIVEGKPGSIWISANDGITEVESKPNAHL